MFRSAIEAVSGSAANCRPWEHEWVLWEGDAADKDEALKNAQKVDPRVSLDRMHVRYEMDLKKW